MWWIALVIYYIINCIYGFSRRGKSRSFHTPQSNGVVERKNRTLIDMARSMLSEYNVSHSFWSEAINTACYCSNRLYCHGKLEKTPYELLNGRKPNIAYFRVFGCKCYILKKGTRLSKFNKKCDEGFLLGYSCNRTDQIIRAQVQKQAPKCSNFRTWAHIIPVVNRNHEGFQTNLLTTKIASFNIQHHTLHFASSSEISLHTRSRKYYKPSL
jgi:hypothetical protein